MDAPVADPGRRLSVFLCHASQDKSDVRGLYRRLRDNDFDVWLDEERLLPGQEWEHEIRKAVRRSDAIIICLSQQAITKRGFVQKEIRLALDVADEQPEGSIFLIPLKLEDCEVPDRLRRWQWVQIGDQRGYHGLIAALHQCAHALGLETAIPPMAEPLRASAQVELRVLVVGGDRDWGSAIRRQFELHKCRVTLASSFRNAESSLTGEDFDIVTVDLDPGSGELAPDLIGVTEARSLIGRIARKHPQPWVFVLSDGLQIDPSYAFELGATYGVKDFIAKRDFHAPVVKSWVDHVSEAKRQELLETFGSLGRTLARLDAETCLDAARLLDGHRALANSPIFKSTLEGFFVALAEQDAQMLSEKLMWISHFEMRLRAFLEGAAQRQLGADWQGAVHHAADELSIAQQQPRHYTLRDTVAVLSQLLRTGTLRSTDVEHRLGRDWERRICGLTEPFAMGIEIRRDVAHGLVYDREAEYWKHWTEVAERIFGAAEVYVRLLRTERQGGAQPAQ